MGEVLQSEPILRLYEHEEIKPPLDDSILEHHGILGMHWGKRNGPPYPLGSDVSTGKRLKGGNGLIARHKRKKKQVKALKKARKTRAENQQIKKTKEEIIRTKDIVAMYKNVDKFTKTEIENVLDRIRTENRLREEVEKLTTPKSKKIFNFVKKNTSSGASNGASEVLSTIAKNGVKTLAKKGMAEFLGDEITNQLLPGGGGGKKKRKKKKKGGAV